MAGALGEEDDVLAVDGATVPTVGVGEDDGSAALEVEFTLEGLGWDDLVLGGPVLRGECRGALVRPAAALLGSDFCKRLAFVSEGETVGLGPWGVQICLQVLERRRPFWWLLGVFVYVYVWCLCESFCCFEFTLW